MTATFASLVSDMSRVTIEGPRIHLPPNAAIVFAMAMHELCTNALKYGSLSQPGGSVELSYGLEDQPGKRLLLRVCWNERGGPRVAPPERSGFGTRMLQEAISFELDGRASLEFKPTGVECVIEFPMNEEATAM